jgi:hypothetical protein
VWNVRLFRARQLVRSLVKLARRGEAAAPVEPVRRRALLLQIDGLSSRRLRQALARGDLPHLKRALDDGELALKSVRAATAPSTPVFQAGLLYGAHADVPGFGWYDRALGRAVRMDLAEDVSAIDRALLSTTNRRRAPPLLGRGVSYGTIWPAGAAQAFFNVVLFAHGKSTSRPLVRNLYDRLFSTLLGAQILGRVTSRLLLELGVGLVDFVRWCTRVGDTRFEWRFLYMRLFVSVVMRDLSTQGALVDVLRGVPVIYLDYLGYDEYAHRRGPDSEMALYNLRGIDAAIERLRRAARAVPEYGYDLYVFSDHGQSATTPFERIVGRDLTSFVLEHVTHRPSVSVPASVIRELVATRDAEFWLRTLWRPLRAPMQLYVGWLKRRLQRALPDEERAPLDAIQVVTGGTIAHLYFGGSNPTVDEIERRHPRLLSALLDCAAIGVCVGRSAAGPVVYYRGERFALSDRAALERIEPVRILGWELFARHVRQAVDGRRSGDLVLYGAFTPHGDVSFDFEFGSHGGLSPEELDQFVAHPSGVAFPLEGAVRAEDFYRFFRQRYLGDEESREHLDAA